MTNTTLLAFVLMGIIGITAPVALVVIWLVKTKQPFTTVLVGAITFIVFALGLETIPKLIFLRANNPIGNYVAGHMGLYMIIAALLAGIFEETGRLVAFKYILKKRNDRMTALSYGIGHGGVEVLLVLGVAGFQYLAYAIMIQAGQFDQIVAEVAAKAPDQVDTIKTVADSIAATSLLTVFWGIIERIAAVLIHISCSIIMFKAVKMKGKMWLYPVAVLIHTSVDMIAALYQCGFISNVGIIVMLFLVWGGVLFAFCYNKVYKKLPDIIEEKNV